ncbi:hypothetical protein GGQ98_003545 [Sphingosinicella soli]|uniref:Uncharacterized protein n=1 Tax=Sphingosinicella soli TaxID=333708 RepID=A0A7W7B6R3_9SPHN|nr:hypothetical protein [Sphingosinicella soli]
MSQADEIVPQRTISTRSRPFVLARYMAASAAFSASAGAQPRRLIEAAARHQHGELLAAEPPDEALPPDDGHGECAHMAQHGVADVVAEAVVHRFEVIDVEQRDRKGRSVHTRGLCLYKNVWPAPSARGFVKDGMIGLHQRIRSQG